MIPDKNHLPTELAAQILERDGEDLLQLKECSHCNYETLLNHQLDHPDLCCDCFDLSCGMDIQAINSERARRVRPPIQRPWPIFASVVDPGASASSEE